MLTKNQKIQLTIDAMSSEGSGIGHFDGIAVFVPGTAIGDVVLTHIVKVKKTYAFGKVEEIVNASSSRIEPDCPVFSQCGGCCFRHINYTEELLIKKQRVADAFQRIGHIDAPINEIIGSENVNSYRNKAQFPVGFDKELKIGFYAINSHRIVACKDCKLQPPIFKEVLDIIEKWINLYNISIYNEVTKKGLLRHIYIRQGYFDGELMVCLVINGESIPKAETLIENLKTVEGFSTLLININKEDTNVIMGKTCKSLFGNGYITDSLLGCKFRISPLSFYQVNSKQAEVLYKKAAEYANLSKSDVLLDLYCGTGTIGLTMANSVSKLYGVEIVPEAIEDAKLNAESNQVTNAEFICGDASLAAEKLKKDGVNPSVILVDPPRKGLTPELIKTIDEMNPKRVVYVSCDPATLARDCAIFKEHGFQVKKATPVDMFPRTAHVETVALLIKG